MIGMYTVYTMYKVCGKYHGLDIYHVLFLISFVSKTLTKQYMKLKLRDFQNLKKNDQKILYISFN